jgi:hypothetical protein
MYMKKLIVVAVAVVMMMGLAGSAMAAGTSLQSGKFGLSAGFTNLSQYPDGIERTIMGRLFIANDLALNLGFGLTSADGDPGMPDGTDLSIIIGVRKYLKTEEFAPFIEGDLVYIDTDTGLNGAYDTIGVLANVGAEYFLHKQFSLEGSVGIGLLQIENNAASSADSTILTTGSLGVRANFYF